MMYFSEFYREIQNVDDINILKRIISASVERIEILGGENSK